MEEYVLAIDDTGFNTNQKHFDSLKSEECCFCSVAVRKDIVPMLESCMKRKTDLLFERFGVREFHFTDMYNRKGNFENIELEETLDIIRSFATDIVGAGMIITVSTINKHSYTNPNQVQIMNMIENIILPEIKLPKDKKSVNLILNIIRSDLSLHKLFENDAFIREVLCDEGIKKAGNNFSLNLSSGKIDVKFEHSTNYLLQFADFVAWFVTRVKHILDKAPQDVKEWENELLRIYSTLPFANMGKAEYVIGSNKKFDYDRTIEELTDELKNQD